MVSQAVALLAVPIVRRLESVERVLVNARFDIALRHAGQDEGREALESRGDERLRCLTVPG